MTDEEFRSTYRRGLADERAAIIEFLRAEADRYKDNGEDVHVWTAVLDCARQLEGGGAFGIPRVEFEPMRTIEP